MLELDSEWVRKVVEDNMDAVSVANKVVIEHIITITTRKLPDRNISDPGY